MKTLFSFFLFLFFLTLGTPLHAQYQVNLLHVTDNGYLILRSVGYAKNKNLALTTAELSAVKAVIFQGIDGAPSSAALIPLTSEEAEQTNKKFFENFYTEGYKQFIAATEIVQPFGKDSNKRKCIVADVTVKVRSLREYLERSGVIRKFGL